MCLGSYTYVSLCKLVIKDRKSFVIGRVYWTDPEDYNLNLGHIGYILLCKMSLGPVFFICPMTDHSVIGKLTLADTFHITHIVL